MLINCNSSRMPSKRAEIAPIFVSRSTLARLLDIAAYTVTEWVKLGHLPPPTTVGTQDRWHWPEVVGWIMARNGVSDGPVHMDDETGNVQGAADPFIAGLKKLKPDGPSAPR